MSDAYVTLRKPMLQERGGEAYHFIIEWFSKHSFKEYLEIVGSFLLGKISDKLVDSLLDSYLLGPFKRAYKKLLSRNSWRLGIDRFSLEFSDTSVSIASFSPESIIENLDGILRNLYYLCEILETQSRMPMYIQIPIIKEEIDGICAFRYLSEQDELLFQKESNNFYEGYWIMFYYLPEQFVVYDVQNKKLIPTGEPSRAR